MFLALPRGGRGELSKRETKQDMQPNPESRLRRRVELTPQNACFGGVEGPAATPPLPLIGSGPATGAPSFL